MRCPKCGVEQPESDTCVSCQIVISKYKSMEEERRLQAIYASVPKARPGRALLDISVVMKIAIAIAFFAIAATAIGWFREGYLEGRVEEGRLIAEAGEKADADGPPVSTPTREYVNRHYGFKLAIPAGWHTFTVDEAISCGRIRRYQGDDYFLITGPWQSPEPAALYVLRPIDSNLLSGKDWKTFVAELEAEGKKILYEDIEDIGGLKVHKAGFMMNGIYKEIHIFKTPGGEVAELYFLINNFNSDGLYAMRDVLATLEKI